MAQDEWERASDELESLVEDNALKTAIDCFIDLQEAMKAMRDAIRGTQPSYRQALDVGERAAAYGTDVLNADMHLLIARVLKRNLRL